MSVYLNMPCTTSDDVWHDMSTCGHTPCLDSSCCSWCIYRAASWHPRQLFNSFRTCMLQCKWYVSYRPECMSNRGDSSGTQKSLDTLCFTCHACKKSCWQIIIIIVLAYKTPYCSNLCFFQHYQHTYIDYYTHIPLYTYTIIHLHCFTNNCKHCPLLKWNILTYAFLAKGQTQKDFSTLQSMYQTEQPPMQSTQHSQAQHTQSNTPAAYSTCL